MVNTINSALSSALLQILRPLVRTLLRNGIAYGTFTELAKKVYVDVAYEEYAYPGRKQTVSRVSALTGLTRKEAKRVLELDRPDDQGANERYHRAVRVISGWVNDPRYHDAHGGPALLPVDGGNPSFAMLVKDYSGDIPTQAMLSALVTAGSVERTEDQVQLVRQAYIPGKDPIDKINILGTDVAELAATIDHNLTAASGELYFQRKVSTHGVPASAVAEFKDMAARKAQALLEELDRWLARSEAAQNEERADAHKYVSLGIYYFEQDS